MADVAVALFIFAAGGEIALLIGNGDSANREDGGSREEHSARVGEEHGVSPIDCRPMTGPERYDAFTLMLRFRSDQAALGDALTLFVEREDYGFVWLAYDGDTCVGCCSIGYAIATNTGGVTAVLRDLYVLPEVRRQGIASAMLASLRSRLEGLGIRCI